MLKVMQLHYYLDMNKFFKWLGKSTLTDRFQTTIPTFVRNELGLEKRDLIEFLKSDDGYIVLRRAEQQQEEGEFSPQLLAWLDFLSNDQNQRPQQIKPITIAMRDKAYQLTGGLDIDLDSALGPENKERDS